MYAVDNLKNNADVLLNVHVLCDSKFVSIVDFSQANIIHFSKMLLYHANAWRSEQALHKA